MESESEPKFLGSAEIGVREMTIIYQIFQGVGSMPELESRAKAPKLGRRKMERGKNVKGRLLLMGYLRHHLTTGVSKELTGIKYY